MINTIMRGKSWRTVVRMELKDWVQLLVGVVFVAGFVGLYNQMGGINDRLIDMNGTLNAIDQRGLNTDARVGRIADALPEMGRRIAQEELAEPIKTAVITTKPVQQTDGRWTQAVFVLDTEKDGVVQYGWPLADERDSSASLLFIGSAYDVEAATVSLSQLEGWSLEVDNTVTFPSFVDTHTSFVFRQATARAYLAGYGEQIGNRVEFSWPAGSPTVRNFYDLASVVEANRGALKAATVVTVPTPQPSGG